MDYHWDFHAVALYAPALLRGGGVALLLSVCSIVPGTLLGTVIAWGRMANKPIIRTIFAVYIEVFFALPVLVLLIWIYYCLPLLLPVTLTAFATAWVCLTFSLSAFVAEIVRSGVASVPVGEVEAARVLGLTPWQTFRLVVFPQAFRRMMPALLGQYITTVKMSSLASIIAVPEIVYQVQLAAARTYRPLELYTAAAAAYVVIVLPLSLLMKRFESRTRTFG